MDYEMHKRMGHSFEVFISNRTFNLFGNIFLLPIFFVSFQDRSKRFSVPHMFHQHYANHIFGIFGNQSRWSLENGPEAEIKRLPIYEKVDQNDDKDHYSDWPCNDVNHIRLQD